MWAAQVGGEHPPSWLLVSIGCVSAPAGMNNLLPGLRGAWLLHTWVDACFLQRAVGALQMPVSGLRVPGLPWQSPVPYTCAQPFSQGARAGLPFLLLCCCVTVSRVEVWLGLELALPLRVLCLRGRAASRAPAPAPRPRHRAVPCLPVHLTSSPACPHIQLLA